MRYTYCMNDPFKIIEPTVISFSGGRTSAYMLWRVLQSNNGKLPEDAIVCFANTGKEEEVINAQNYYCEHQQQNPHTPRVMMSLGLPEETVKTFCTDNLFPKI